MPTIITGAQTSANQLAANKMPEIDRAMYLLEPLQAPIFRWLYFSQGSPAAPVYNEDGQYSWFEKERYPYQTTFSSALSAPGASNTDNISLTDATWIAEGDVLLLEDSEELVYVDSTASSQIDITSLDGSNISACSSGTYVRKVGSRNTEFATARTAVAVQEVQKSNYCEIHSESATTSGRHQAGKHYTSGKTHKDAVKEKIIDMRLEIERNFAFSTSCGSAPSPISATDYRHTWSMGALGRITTNKTSHSGALTETALDSYFETVFAKGTKMKRHYAGSSQITAIHKIVKDKQGYQIMDGATEYGLSITAIRTPFGMVKLFWNPVMEGKFTNWGITLDEKATRMRYMANDEKGSRKFRVEDSVETPGTDGKTSKILFDVSIQIPNESENGILYKA